MVYSQARCTAFIFNWVGPSFQPDPQLAEVQHLSTH